MESTVQVSHFVKQWRKHRGYTQSELSRLIGISRAYLAQIETGARDYSQDFLESASKSLRCSPADIIACDPNKGPPIYEAIHRLTYFQRYQLISIAEILAQQEHEIVDT
jgi:transcriptional regulator with XRE-family HTH domain